MVIKTSSSTSISDEETGAKAKVEQKTSGEEALHVIAEISNSSMASSPVPAFDGTKYNALESNTEIVLSNSGTGTQVYEYTGAGMLESFLLKLESKDTIVYLFIDGVQRYAIDCAMFNSIGFEHEKQGEFPVAFDTGDKIFKHYPRYPLTFNTSFEVKAKANGKKIKAWTVSYIEA